MTNIQQRRILAVDDDAATRVLVSEFLSDCGFSVQVVADPFKALALLEEGAFDLVLTDLNMPGMSGLELVRRGQAMGLDCAYVVMTAFGSVDAAVEAIKLGASEFITKPLNLDVLEVVVPKALERLRMARELAQLRAVVEGPPQTPILGRSPAMRRLLDLIDTVAASRSTVLITGESGTGKELVANAIHQRSNRSAQPFIRVHCAALSESLLESELFGHDKGAFTGAHRTRQGRFEQAHKGTLFLDEIGELGAAIQVKLLRVLQERRFERVGGNETLDVDIRLIAATHRNLKEEVRAGRFRDDLYYRLKVVQLETPPLRVRREDIPLLARYFVDQYAAENNKDVSDISPEVEALLCAYDWPGNVRELQNTIESAVVMCRGPRLEREHLPDDLTIDALPTPDVVRIPGSSLTDIERHAILTTYQSCGGSTARTAEILGISVRKVRYKLKEYLSPDELG